MPACVTYDLNAAKIIDDDDDDDDDDDVPLLLFAPFYGRGIR